MNLEEYNLEELTTEEQLVNGSGAIGRFFGWLYGALEAISDSFSEYARSPEAAAANQAWNDFR